MQIEFVELVSNKELARQIFEQADNGFYYHLGFYGGIEAAIEKVTTFDSRNKYWAVKYGNELIGFVCIYDYDDYYNKCSLGYGLLPDYRGKGFTVDIVNEFCSYLEDSMGMIRIQADIDVTNKHCLNSIESVLNQIGFDYEYTAKNYWGQDSFFKIYSRCKEH